MRVPGLKTARRLGWRARASLGGVGVVLGYHRVTALRSDPHHLAVHPDHFRAQMEVLRANYRPVALDDLPEAVRESRSGAPPPVAVTFDDGYHDVVSEALPILEELEVPATLFVLPGLWGQVPPWEEGGPASGPRLVEEAEVRALARHPLITIGSHTLTHPAMDELPRPDRTRELRESRAQLELVIMYNMTRFSHPFGRLWPGHEEEVRTAGYQLACTSRNGLVTAGANPISLPRLWPPDVGGPDFARWLGGWTGVRGSRGPDEGADR